MSKNIITANNFTKSFGTKSVIDDLSFEVKKGEIFAFLGSNGSGKTTTVRCLLNIYRDYEGKLEVFGERFNLNNSSRLGYLPEERGLYLNMKVEEMLTYFAEIKGLPSEEIAENIDWYLDYVDLEEKRHSEVKKLSSGQQQKIQLGVTLIHKPELLILDEPTKGLDPVNRRLLIDLLKKLNDEGTTIMFSTHILEEAEKIADRIGILHDGNFSAYGDIKQVKREFSDSVEVEIQKEERLPKLEDIFIHINRNES